MPPAQRNPSLETSKSSVELERGQVAGVAAETRQLQSRQTSARHFTFDQEEVRRQQGGGQLGQDSVSLVNERYQQQQTETIQNKEHQQDNHLDTNQQQNVVSHQQQQSSNSMYQHQSDGGQSSVQQSQHHQQQHTITQSSNNMTTTTTTKTVLTSEQWSSTNSTQHQSNKLATTTTELNNNTSQHQDNKLATTTTANNSSSQVQHSTAVGVGHEPMSYVASAKLKEQQVAGAGAGAGEVSVAYREFAAGVSGAAAAGGATVARAASNTSSSSSGAILASSVHPTVDLVKTSTPTHSRTSDSGSESSGHASNVSNVSNEEIVRQHLKQFNQTATVTPEGGQHVVTARGRGRQYNTVTEQYVSSAVRGAEAATREAEDTVRPLEVDTGRVVPVVVDQEGYQRALAAKREAELQLVTEIAGQQQLVTEDAGAGQLVTQAAGAGQLVSHTELMQEHFHADSLQAAPGHSSPATAAQVAVSAARTAAEKNILAAEQFTAASAAGHTVGEAGDTSTDSLGSQGQVRKKYIITQQEIVFYIRNADGTVRIVNR